MTSNGNGGSASAATVGPVAVTSGPAKEEHELGLFAATLKHHRHLPFLHLGFRSKMIKNHGNFLVAGMIWDDDDDFSQFDGFC